MLHPLFLGPSKEIHPLNRVSPRLQPLLAAANRGDDVAPIVEAIARSFGFDGFMYAVSLSPRPDHETRSYVYHTWPDELARLYDERAFVEVDPRLQDIHESVVPLVWDQETYRGKSREVDGFLDLMQSYGLSSGIYCPVRDGKGRIAVMSLSSSAKINDDVRMAMIAQVKGDILLFGLYFHELYVQGVMSDLAPGFQLGGKLSRRERQCLTMAAHGLQGGDIAHKLSISLRTIQAHFDSIRAKLGAATRIEAVAIGLRTGIISLSEAPTWV